MALKTLLAFEMASGQVVYDFEYSSLSWGIRLNKSGDISADVRLTSEEVDQAAVRTYTLQKKHGLAVVEGGRIIEAGHISGRTFSDDGTSVSLTARGLWGYLEHLLVHSPEFNPDTDDPRLDKFTLAGTRADIARQLIRNALDAPSAVGHVPVVITPGDGETGTVKVEYDGADITTLAEALTDLIDANGPDQDFVPEFTDSNRTHIRWRHKAGTASRPLNYRAGEPHILDHTVAKSRILGLGVDEDGSGIANRFWATGDGDATEVGVATATNELMLDRGFPLLEAVVSHSSKTREGLTSRVMQDAKEAAGAWATWSLNVRLEVGDEYEPGDLAHVYTRGHRSVPNGRRLVRIIGVDGDHGSNVKLHLQPIMTTWENFDASLIPRRYIEPDLTKKEAEDKKKRTPKTSTGSGGSGGGSTSSGIVGTVADPWGDAETGARVIIPDENLPQTVPYNAMYSPAPGDKVALGYYTDTTGGEQRLVLQFPIALWDAGTDPGPDGERLPGTFHHYGLNPQLSGVDRTGECAYTVVQPGDEGSANVFPYYATGEFQVNTSGTYVFEAQVTWIPSDAQPYPGYGSAYRAFMLNHMRPNPSVYGGWEYLTGVWNGPGSPDNTREPDHMSSAPASEPLTQYIKRTLVLRAEDRFSFRVAYSVPVAKEVTPAASYMKVYQVKDAPTA